MLDLFNRDITYLRISLTDKCNLRCIYCVPDGKIKKTNKSYLSVDQIVEIVEAAGELGISKIKLTGGEPLLRDDIEEIVEKLFKIKTITEIGITTNGILLSKKARILKQNGLKRVNISLDTLDPTEYRRITRIGNISQVLEGIDASIEAGLHVKINMVVMKDTKVKIQEMRNFVKTKNIELQLINHFSLNTKKKNDPFFERPPKCQNCNRIRLLSDGRFKPCLFSNDEFKVDFKDIKKTIIKTIHSKPESGSFCENRDMNEIGG